MVRVRSGPSVYNIERRASSTIVGGKHWRGTEEMRDERVESRETRRREHANLRLETWDGDGDITESPRCG